MKQKPLEGKLADDLQALVKAAAVFFDLSQREHRATWPEDAEAFAALALLAGAKPTIRIGLFPDPSIEVGYDHAGVWHAFFTWSARGPRVDPMSLN